MIPTVSRIVDKSGCNSGLKRGLTIILHLAASVLAGTLLLFGVYMIPVERIDGNVRESAYTMKTEGNDYILSECFTSQLDNFTDSIMMLEAANKPVISPLIDAMNVPRGDIEAHTPQETLVAHYIDGTEFENTVYYPRYWHGYLVFIKPLFLLFNYGTIRLINGITQVFVVILICCLLQKKGLGLAIIPYLLSYGMMMPLALAKALQYSSCFYMLTFGIIVLLLLPTNKLRSKSYLVFLYCGILTAFFDFLPTRTA